ncbi:hypothetical protein ACIRQH_34745 [Streptomyces sp. NPDC102279]|uniref:hypothetical protein n=1 Tax=Streptomyces sp. NPDC102279 TaxID=3366153 RepID=UPI0038042C9D
MTESSKPPLSFTTGANGLHGLLRGDRLRLDTLIGLVATWDDPEAREDVIAQLDALAEAVTSPREGELDQLVQHVEDAAGMDTAQIEVQSPDLIRLRDELNRVIAATSGRFNPSRSQGASDIRHPAMRATRTHLKANPFPTQDGRRTA